VEEPEHLAEVAEEPDVRKPVAVGDRLESV
jgi:hypothetical protein